METRTENSAPQTLSGEKLLTRAEVEETFGFPTKRYLEIAAMGTDGPPIVRFGRTVRYRVSDLRGWIQSHCVEEQATTTE